MRGRLGIPLTLIGAALVVTGLALGAQSQHETFQGQGENEQLEAAGSLVALTAFLCGIGAALIAVAWGHARWRQKLLAAPIVAFSTWLLVLLVQGDFPNFNAVEGSGQANMSQNTLLSGGDGAATVLLPVVVAGLVLLWGTQSGFARAAGRDRESADLAALHRRLLAASCLAVPFLAVVVTGSMQVMLATPATTEGAGLLYVLLPVAALSAVAWLVILFLRLWHARALLEDARIQPFTMEAWYVLARVEWAVIGVLAMTGILSTALPSVDTPATGVGRTLIFTLRSHGQGLAFSIVALVPAVLAARRFRRAMDVPLEGNRPATRTTVAFTISAGIGLLGCLLAGFGGTALLPWIFATIPLAIFAGIHLPSNGALPIMALSSWILWAQGNTFAATYDAARFPTLDFAVHPGLLALLRVLGAALAAWTMYRVMDALGAGERRRLVVPLALVAAAGFALTGLLEMPLWLWDEGRVPENKLAIGSLLRSQNIGVQVTAHIMAFIAGGAAVLAASRLARPDWFTRRPGSADVAVAAPA